MMQGISRKKAGEPASLECRNKIQQLDKASKIDEFVSCEMLKTCVHQLLLSLSSGLWQRMKQYLPLPQIFFKALWTPNKFSLCFLVSLAVIYVQINIRNPKAAEFIWNSQ
jgi:hypothetical protein